MARRWVCWASFCSTFNQFDLRSMGGRRSYEARPPPAQDLLAIISTDPQSPTSPPALIPSAASLYDVSLDPALFAPRATGGQLTAFRMPSSDPPPSRPVLIPNAAYAEDVSLNSALIPKKAQESQPKSPEMLNTIFHLRALI
ncbi:hypothetical protein H4Q26_012959 [Puccinia striiformis f. sp. tritici PST-130]|nr:hypothetical protein H4Q26_012959 [Puccinia striiformis f. sp. tritici PST-130]